MRGLFLLQIYQSKVQPADQRNSYQVPQVPIYGPSPPRIWIFLKLHIFFITKRPSLNAKPVNPLIQSTALIHVKKMWFQKISRFVWTGAINWYLRDLVTVPLICWLSSALIYLQQKGTSHLHSRNLLEITATNNVTVEVHIKKGTKRFYTIYSFGW